MLPLHPPVKGRGLHCRAFGVSPPVPVVKVSKAVLLPAIVRAVAEAGICVQSHLLVFIPVGLVSSKREEIAQLSGTAHANANSCPTTRGLASHPNHTHRAPQTGCWCWLRKEEFRGSRPLTGDPHREAALGRSFSLARSEAAAADGGALLSRERSVPPPYVAPKQERNAC